MKRNKIVWLTSDCYLDVDLPIVPGLGEEFDIKWFVGINKSNQINYLPLISKSVKNKRVILDVINFKRRIRNPLLILEFIKLINNIRKEKADVYYMNMSGMPYFFPLVRLLLGKNKVVVATHNVTTPKGAHSEYLAKLYMKFTLRFFKNFHVFSKVQKIELELLYPSKKILLAPLALKDFGASNVEKPEIVTFLNFGIIRDYKRLDILINAANKTFEKTKTLFKVKIVGNCSNWKKYQDLIKYPELFDLTISSIPNEDIPGLFLSSHYFVLPYQDIAQSGALTVALNYNLPVLASDLEAFREFVVDKETGYLFKAGSVNELSNLMSEMIENHHFKYNLLQQNQQKYVEENLCINSIVEKYSQFFKSRLV